MNQWIVLMIQIVLTTILVLVVSLFLWARRRLASVKQPKSIAFFHPHCSAGGGGERVLWKAIEAIILARKQEEQEVYQHIIVYTSDPSTPDYRENVLQKVKERFSIDIPSATTSQPQFIHIPPKQNPANFKRFTLLAESWDTITLAWKALRQVTPSVYVDTTGCAFTFLVAKLLGQCHVVAYVHYPTVSKDMLQLVWERRPSYNNQTSTSRSTLATYVKLLYYCMFAVLYGGCGSLADLVFCNSSWTYNHIRSLWRMVGKKQMHILYPPCNTVVTTTAAITTTPGKQKRRAARNPQWIVSIGQFRPEKDHALQIRALAQVLENEKDKIKQRNNDWQVILENRKDSSKWTLIVIGSCRNKDDEARVAALKALAYEELQLSTRNVEFLVNPPFSTVQEYFKICGIGLHTMWNEHFGIGIVEMMAAGLIVVAHNSGGPKSDIITPGKNGNGFLASTVTEYAAALEQASSLSLSDDNDDSNVNEMQKMRQRAHDSAKRFSDDVFQEQFMKLLSCLR